MANILDLLSRPELLQRRNDRLSVSLLLHISEVLGANWPGDIQKCLDQVKEQATSSLRRSVSPLGK